MLCPKCNISAAIRHVGYVVDGDNDPNKETKLYVEQKFMCRNPQCADYGKVIGRKRNPIRLEKDEEQEA